VRLDEIQISTIHDWIAGINRSDVYRMLPGRLILSMRMIMTIIRWPPVFGASDDALIVLMAMLQVGCDQ
jgi:hypothetical protein